MRSFGPALAVVFTVSTGAFARPTATFHATLDDLASITATNGYISDGPASFVPGAVNSALAGHPSAYARWDDAAVGATFEGLRPPPDVFDRLG